MKVAISLTLWFPAFWLIANAKNCISSCEVARALGVTQKAAWFMLHRIRHVMSQGQLDMFKGTVEVDETYVGGKEINKHSNKKVNAGGGTVGKSVVMAFLERGTGKTARSKVLSKIVLDNKQKTLQDNVVKHVKAGSRLYTDSHKSYKGLSEKFMHDFVEHKLQYVKNHISTNGLENFFSGLKRTLKGTYIKVEPFHLTSYIDEQTFRFNTRKTNDSQRFVRTLQQMRSYRLKYKTLISAYREYFDQAMPIAV